ncbi:hypothetical protein Bca52824_050435 [Brassica carinata]|uniref:Protein kinase domain-containing protein n=1 Tax=Brassica carinata TaxID=52824 RepID=A0A8X7QZ53_BRACI|nr:hypothetical protein Bca52824_050435 [Brassica carinata]
MKRVASAGLRTELVLQRKTENFTRTTFLCMEKATGKERKLLTDEDMVLFTDVVGSPYYVAPEADAWSAGVIVHILLSGLGWSGHPWVQVDGVAPDKPLDSLQCSAKAIKGLGQN